MKKIFAVLFYTLVCSFILSAPAQAQPTAAPTQEGIRWYTFAEVEELSKTAPRPILIDIYTDWCGWCKRMDANTFSRFDVSEAVIKQFYPVRFNAEQREEVTFLGHTFKWIPSGSKGVHELAVALTDNNLSYPTLVYFNEKGERIMISPGYKEAKDLYLEFEFIKDRLYEQEGVTFDLFKKKRQAIGQ